MDFLKNDTVITKILLPAFYPKEKGTPTPMHRESHALVLNVDCWSVYRFNTGEELVCRSGDCIFLPKGSGYIATRYPQQPTETRGIYAINFLTLGEEQMLPFSMHVRAGEELSSLFSRAVQCWRKRNVGFEEECLSALYRIIALLKREAADTLPVQKQRAMLAPALEYINEHYTEESIPLSRLAALCGISEPYLRKLFQSVFSVSPSIYMRNLRIRYARELLSSGEYSVTDAAMLSGFNDAAYFSREFKRAVGVAPKDYGANLANRKIMTK